MSDLQLIIEQIEEIFKDLIMFTLQKQRLHKLLS